MEYDSNTAKNVDGSVSVEKGKVIVKDPVEHGQIPTIKPPEFGSLYRNGEKITRQTKVKYSDEIEFKNEIEVGKRYIKIETNEDKTEAYLTVDYEKNKKYSLIDLKENLHLDIETETLEGEYPPFIEFDELMKIIKAKKIIYGINEENIIRAIEDKSIYNLLIAKGYSSILPREDQLKLLFMEENFNEVKEEQEKIDYREINNVISVKESQIIAEIIEGENGKEGKNVFGDIIKAKDKKNVKFIIGQGCILKDNNIKSTISGIPKSSKNKIWIEPLYILNDDVKIANGNINFTSNVQIEGRVTEGMKVVAGAAVNIRDGVFSSSVSANAHSKILGNIVNSTIEIGGQNLVKEERRKALETLKEEVSSLIANLNFLKERKLINANNSLGLVIKGLIETKYKSIPKLCVKVMSSAMKDHFYESIVVISIKKKLLGASPSNIKSINELENIIFQINEELKVLEDEVKALINLTIEYSQESKINVTGDIIVTGKGLFTSELYSTNNISFLNKGAVCRGGYLRAENGIYAASIGSQAGVITKLEVEKKGEIKADIAYQNTVFIVGTRKYILDKPSKDIHVFLDKDGTITVNKLLL